MKTRRVSGATCCLSLLLIFGGGLWLAYWRFAVYYEAEATRQSEPILEVLPQIEQVTIGATRSHGDWLYIVHGGCWATYLGHAYFELRFDLNPKTLAELAAAEDPHSNPIAPIVDRHDLLLMVRRKKPRRIYERHIYAYIPETGELGWGNLWVTTSPKFQTWMRRLIAKTASQQSFGAIPPREYKPLPGLDAP